MWVKKINVAVLPETMVSLIDDGSIDSSHYVISVSCATGPPTLINITGTRADLESFVRQVCKELRIFTETVIIADQDPKCIRCNKDVRECDHSQTVRNMVNSDHPWV